MQWLKINIISYIVCIVFDSIIFVLDAVFGQGGSGRISDKFGPWIIILVSILILIGTTGYLFNVILKVNRLVLAILSILASCLQIIILIAVVFLVNMYILAPILGKLGFYITMP